MAKKSNKTSHVLNLITNRTGIPAEELEQPYEPEREHIVKKLPIQIVTPIQVTSPVQAPSPMQVTAPVQAPAPVQAVAPVQAPAPSVAYDNISERIRAALEKIHVQEESERVETRKALKALMEEKKTMIAEKVRNIQPVIPPKAYSEPQIDLFTPENFAEGSGEIEELPEENAPVEVVPIKPPAEVKEVKEENKDSDGLTMDGLVLINILEEVIRMEAPKIMAGMGMCCCERCVNDVMAIALNKIPSKYVVSRKGALFAKIASYGNQYKTDILAGLTQACVIVEKSPSHD